MKDKVIVPLILLCVVTFIGGLSYLLAYQEEAVFQKGDCFSFGVYRLVRSDYVADHCYSTKEVAKAEMEKLYRAIRERQKRGEGWGVLDDF